MNFNKCVWQFRPCSFTFFVTNENPRVLTPAEAIKLDRPTLVEHGPGQTEVEGSQASLPSTQGLGDFTEPSDGASASKGALPACSSQSGELLAMDVGSPPVAAHLSHVGAEPTGRQSPGATAERGSATPDAWPSMAEELAAMLGEPLPRSVALADLRVAHAHQRDEQILLDETRHVYIYTDESGAKLEFSTSVSGVWGMYFDKFDPEAVVNERFDRWAAEPTNRYHEQIARGRGEGRSNEELKKEIMDGWAAQGAEASCKGTYMHRQIEFALNDLEYDGSLPEMCHFQNWVHDVPEVRGWRAYRTEWSIFSMKTKIAGQIDAVFTDSAGCYHMVDWKRCREPFDPEAKRHFGRLGKHPLDYMVDNEYNHYVVQQNLYRTILRTEYDIELASMALVRCHPDAKTYQHIEVPFMDNELLVGILVTAGGRLVPSHAAPVSSEDQEGGALIPGESPAVQPLSGAPVDEALPAASVAMAEPAAASADALSVGFPAHADGLSQVGAFAAVATSVAAEVSPEGFPAIADGLVRGDGSAPMVTSASIAALGDEAAVSDPEARPQAHPELSDSQLLRIEQNRAEAINRRRCLQAEECGHLAGLADGELVNNDNAPLALEEDAQATERRCATPRSRPAPGPLSLPRHPQNCGAVLSSSTTSSLCSFDFPFSSSCSSSYPRRGGAGMWVRRNATLPSLWRMLLRSRLA